METPSPGLRHVPALDGIRALALVAVLLYHGEMTWMPGGFLGVSVFFTLSGYLITSMLLREHEQTERIDPVAFWGRRFRRLAPASLVTIGAVVAFGALAGITDEVLADARASVLHVANWWSIAGEASYADLFVERSPLEHFWSLAIEEQIYVVFPVLGWLCLRGAHGPARRRFALVLAGLTAASLAATLLNTDTNRVYLGTDTRAAELLVGALLAFAWPLEVRGTHLRAPASVRFLRAAGGGAALVALALLCSRTSIQDGWLYRGGLPAVALVSATLLAVAARPGPVATFLATRPLVRLGAVSYGMYLFHWPVFLVLDQQSTGLAPEPLLAVRVVVTWRLAAMSYRLLEEPVRRRRWLAPGPARVALAGAMAAVLLATVTTRPVLDETTLLAAGDGRPVLGLTTSEADERPPVPSTTAGTEPVHSRPGDVRPFPALDGPPTAAGEPPPRTVAFAGDSVASVLTEEIGDLGPEEFGVEVLNLGIEACDGAPGNPLLRYGDGSVLEENPWCSKWPQTWAKVFEQHPPGAVVLLLGGAAVLDRQVDGRWSDACQPDFRRWYLDALRERIDWLQRSTDATVFLATSPWAKFGKLSHPFDHFARTDCLNDMYDTVAAERPSVRRLDARGFVCPEGRDSCRDLRSDGLHFRGEGAFEFARWALPVVMEGW